MSPINIILFIIFIAIAAKRLPAYLESKKFEGTKIEYSNQAILLDGTRISLPLPKKQILVFWATWCGPCTVELGRINKMIASNEIDKNSVFAVSSGEDPALIAKTAKERGYEFQVAFDPNMDLRERFKVDVTPTVVFIDEEKTVQWMSTGISPTLGFRIKNFLN